MEDREIFKRLEQILKNPHFDISDFDISDKEINPETNLSKDLGLDSLDICKLVYFVEEDFGISIPDGKMNEFRTVKDYINYIKDYQSRHTI